MEINRYKIELSFDGTDFCGWQIQPNAISVQQTIEDALSILIKEKINVVGCGRTDTGVHALFYVAHFDSNQLFSDEELNQITFRLNSFLKDNISIFNISLTDFSFHARFSPTLREYQYYILTRKNPFKIKFAYKLNNKLNIEKMNAAAELLLGTHDFQSFSKVNTQVNNFICTVFYANFTLDNDTIVFKIAANRFLRNMVRAIVGTIIDVGKEKITIEEFRKIIESKNRNNAGLSVPPNALFLTKIEY